MVRHGAVPSAQILRMKHVEEKYCLLMITASLDFEFGSKTHKQSKRTRIKVMWSLDPSKFENKMQHPALAAICEPSLKEVPEIAGNKIVKFFYNNE